MNVSRVLPLLLAASVLSAQTPLFLDGPAFGGSRVFSAGLNPLGNPARYGQATPGWHLTWLDGTQESKDFSKSLRGARAGEAPALASLEENPWGGKLRAFGLGLAERDGHMSYTREEQTGVLAAPDLSGATVRRSVVDRLSFGAQKQEGATTLGATLRVERWSLGMASLPLGPGTPDPLGFSTTDQRKLRATMDLGFQVELVQGIHWGGTVDRLVGQKMWDVHDKPQYRTGLLVELGTTSHLSLETDLNDALRMPYPLKQRTSSASLTLKANPSLTLVFGAERRKVGDVSVTRGGATLWFHPLPGHSNQPSMLVGIGLQVGADRPLKGASMWWN